MLVDPPSVGFPRVLTLRKLVRPYNMHSLNFLVSTLGTQFPFIQKGLYVLLSSQFKIPRSAGRGGTLL